MQSQPCNPWRSWKPLPDSGVRPFLGPLFCNFGEFLEKKCKNMCKKRLAWKSGLAGAIAGEKMTIFWHGKPRGVFRIEFMIFGLILRKNYAKKRFFALWVGAGRPLHSTSEPIPLPGRPAPTPRATFFFCVIFAFARRSKCGGITSSLAHKTVPRLPAKEHDSRR